EKAVATSLKEASELLALQPNAMELRQTQALLDISKEESSMVIIYPMNSLMGQQIATATAGNMTSNRKKKPVVQFSE
ncbi:MAG: hypothetical protein K8S24_02070, partial [Candidatus Aegiribacteria sp.]|nr:hypothetical protein [Candidatus Aegiribacteria sp.]